MRLTHIARLLAYPVKCYGLWFDFRLPKKLCYDYSMNKYCTLLNSLNFPSLQVSTIYNPKISTTLQIIYLPLFN